MQKMKPKHEKIVPKFNAAMSLEHFWVDEKNRLAYQAANYVTHTPTPTPLCLYGASRTGKTHLLQAIANQITLLRPPDKVIYVHAERYVANLATPRGTPEAGQQYDSADVLLIDAIEFMAGHYQRQESLLTTLNVLRAAGKQFVCSSAQHPSELLGMDARLMAFFCECVAVEIGAA